MQVVELADRGDPREQHLAVHRSGEVVVRVRGERRGDGVHLLAPSPEGAALGLCPAAERPVERVTVAVRQAWQHKAFQLDRITGVTVDVD